MNKFISIYKNKFKLYNNYLNYLKYKNKKNYGKFETIDFVPKLNNNNKQKIKITLYPKSKVPYKDQDESRDF
jgi:hypothetical protein